MAIFRAISTLKQGFFLKHPTAITGFELHRSLQISRAAGAEREHRQAEPTGLTTTPLESETTLLCWNIRLRMGGQQIVDFPTRKG